MRESGREIRSDVLDFFSVMIFDDDDDDDDAFVLMTLILFSFVQTMTTTLRSNDLLFSFL